MADELKNSDWIDEAFERGYQLGLAHGSKNTGLTWVNTNTVRPDSGTEVIVAVARKESSKKRNKRKKLQGHEAYGMLTGIFYDERDAIEKGAFLFFSEPQCVVVIHETNSFILWSDVLAWAYLNTADIGEEKGD